MHRISIITICFNNREDVISTIESVDFQSVPPFEHLIIDGSTDPAIRTYLETTPQPPYRRWISERDKGISDAFNKGILNAAGDLIVMLNSGDRLYDPSALDIVSQTFAGNPGLQWLHSRYELHRGHTWIIIGKPFDRSKAYRGMRSICHQTMFVRKELHQKHGLYDLDLKIAMDYDFLLRIENEKFVFLQQPLVKFAPAGTSSVHYLRSLDEIRKIYTRYHGKSIWLELWQLRLRFLYHLLNTRLGKFLFKVKTRLKLENM